MSSLISSDFSVSIEDILFSSACRYAPIKITMFRRSSLVDTRTNTARSTGTLAGRVDDDDNDDDDHL
jgi:hypothetical protein